MEQMYLLEYKHNSYYRIHLSDNDYIEFLKCRQYGNYVCVFDDDVQQPLCNPRCTGIGGAIMRYDGNMCKMREPYV